MSSNCIAGVGSIETNEERKATETNSTELFKEKTLIMLG